VEELKKALFALVAGAVTVWTFLVPDAPMFNAPEFARMFFWHFPCPIMLTGLIAAGAWSSYRALAGGSAREVWDLRAVAAFELGLIYLVLTMGTGMLFSKYQWGAFWSWDPRQTSFLIAMLMYGAYFAVRSAFADPEKRAANAAAYMLATLLPQLFLIYVYPRLPSVMSLHPSSTIMGGQLHGGYLYVMLANMAVVGVLTVWLYRLRVRAGLLLLEPYGNLEDRRRPAGPRVVRRSVPLPHEGGADR